MRYTILDPEDDFLDLRYRKNNSPWVNDEEGMRVVEVTELDFEGALDTYLYEIAWIPSEEIVHKAGIRDTVIGYHKETGRPVSMNDILITKLRNPEALDPETERVVNINVMPDKDRNAEMHRWKSSYVKLKKRYNKLKDAGRGVTPDAFKKLIEEIESDAEG